MPNSLELNVSPAQLHTFANHPFHVRKDMEMNELVDSIRESGVIVPCLYVISNITRKDQATATMNVATVTAVFSPDGTITRYGSSLAYAGLPHTNKHLCDNVFIIILLTSALLSPRPG